MFESSQQVIVGIYQYEVYDHMCDVCSHGTYAKSVYSVITFIVSLYQYLNWKRNDVALSPSQWGSILRVWIFEPWLDPQSTKVHVSGFNSANHGRNWIPSLFTTNSHFQTPDECIFFTQSTQEIHKSSSQGGFPFNNLFLRSFESAPSTVCSENKPHLWQLRQRFDKRWRGKYLGHPLSSQVHWPGLKYRFTKISHSITKRSHSITRCRPYNRMRLLLLFSVFIAICGEAATSFTQSTAKQGRMWVRKTMG